MRQTLALFVCLLGISCGQAKQDRELRFADLKGFFTQEAARLKTNGARVNKTVSRNELSESQNGIVPDWEDELSLFTESDINRPAWRDNYEVKKTDSSITYTATDEKMRTRTIRIDKDAAGNFKNISIVNHTGNSLYTSSEKLNYKPDAGYTIEKSQHVVLIGDNHYAIKSDFSQ